ncbi:MAG: adenylate kinase [Chloroflexi bacterium]|nr:adenylate kinase [Chloroflexota bacterium]
MDIVLLGPPGVGKGTQAERLEAWLGLPQVSSGDLFREAIAKGTRLGRKAEGYIDRGELVPDQVTIDMIAERIAKPDCAKGVILDGFPRTVEQARILDELLAKMGRRVDIVLDIEASEETLLERLTGRWLCRQCGRVYHRLSNPEQVRGICDECGGRLYQREDDRPKTQRRRLQVYQDRTVPLQAYYRRKGVLVDIDGEGDVESVWRQIKAAVEPLVAQKA